MTGAQAIAVAAGGALGTLLRFAVGAVLPSARWPWATLAVNVLGALAMGWIMRHAIDRGQLEATWRLAVTVGVLGGFTTFSALAFESVQLFHAGRTWAAIAYVGVTVVVGLAACALGLRR